MVVAFGVFGAYYAMGTQEGIRDTKKQLADHQYEVLARNAALAGYNESKQGLAEDFNNTDGPFSGAYDDADYSVTLMRNGSIVKIVSEGIAYDENGDEVTFHIIAEIEQEYVSTIADEAPPYMQYALLTEDDLSLNGDILTDLYVQGDEENTLNANMHTNGNLSIRGNSVEVRGFGTFVGSGSASPSSALYNSFQPNYNPTGDPTAQQTTEVEIPVFDAATFVSKVSVDQTTVGDESISSDLDLGGTRDDPYIWYIDGNLFVTGNTQLSGYVMFIVDGNVTFTGNMTAGESGYDGGDESSIALYASGSVSLGGNTEVYGQIYAGGDVALLHGTTTVNGSVTTLGAGQLRGTPQIYYRQASPALTTIFQDPETRIQLISYSEW